MKSLFAWIVGGSVSVGLHVALALFMMLGSEPEPLEADPQPSGKIKMEAYEVSETHAKPQENRGQEAEAETAEGENLSQGAVRTDRAEIVDVSGERAAAQEPDAEKPAEVEPPSEVVAPTESAETVVAATEASGAETPALFAQGAVVAAASLAADSVPVVAAKAQAAQPVETAQPAQQSVAAKSATLVAVATPASVVVAPTESAETVVAATKASGAATPALFAQGAVVAAASLAADSVPAVAVKAEAAQPVESVQPAQQSVAAKSATLVAAAASPAAVLKAAPAESITLASANAPAETLIPTAPRAGPVAASPILGENTGQISPDAPLAEPTAPPSNPVAQTDANEAAQQLASAEPETDSLLAVTSFAGNGGAPFDPVSLAAVASFMRPSDTADSADSARDGIAQLLSQVPCARVAATFVPETGELELRGHVPKGDMRGPIVEAIRAQLGNSIPVSGSMLVLPSPQCNVLDDLEDIGLPQSVDQANDSLQVGASTQLVTLDYAEGQIVEIPIRGSEFASYVYLDFFQIDGNVFHMLPNEYTPLELIEPDVERKIGDNPDGLTLIVQPPFGMELVVAYTSSEPLYDGVRDIQEPSEPYLAFMQEQIALLREEHEDYKGEWVYMFVQTHGATN